MAQGHLVLWRRPPETDLLANEGLHRMGLTSAFALPLWCGDQVGGAIMAGSTGGHRLVTDEHLVVAAIAGQLLMAATGGIDGVHQLALRFALSGREVR